MSCKQQCWQLRTAQLRQEVGTNLAQVCRPQNRSVIGKGESGSEGIRGRRVSRGSAESSVKQHSGTVVSDESRETGRTYVRPIRSRECLCSEFSLAQQNRTKEGLGPVLAGQRGSAHRTDMKVSGFIRQRGRGNQTTAGSGRSAGQSGSWPLKEPRRVSVLACSV